MHDRGDAEHASAAETAWWWKNAAVLGISGQSYLQRFLDATSHLQIEEVIHFLEEIP